MPAWRSFQVLRYSPRGLIGTILISYEAVAILILFILLWMAFQKARQAQKARKQEAEIARQSSQLWERQQDFQKPKAQSSRRDIQRRKDSSCETYPSSNPSFRYAQIRDSCPRRND